MTPERVAELRDAEHRLTIARDELVGMLQSESVTLHQMKQQVILVLLIEQNIEALLHVSSCVHTPAGNNVIPFPSNRRVH